ncbi:MAG: NAD-dependent epimerase/dehydratase family protein [Pseudomonadales bacterium]|nr:NAD-dependent epimerase/dehydratase family protein [Pseudomonadales bacterium]
MNKTDTKPSLHVVIGAAGSIGAEITRQLTASGKLVRGLVRSIPKHSNNIDYVIADAMNQDELVSACEDAIYVYHCLNVPYEKWCDVMPVVTKNVLEAVKQAKAKLIFVGNVYGYGRLQNIPVSESHPMVAETKKGALRNQLEDMLWRAHHAEESKVVIARFPDFYGPGVVNGLMKPIFDAAITGGKCSWPAALDVQHDLVFIGDAARACILLAEKESSYGESWHVPGAGSLTGRDFIEMVYRETGSKPAASVLSKWMLTAAGFFNAGAKELIELLYEFSEPLILDGSKFANKFPDFKYNPHQEAVVQTVDWYKQQVEEIAK